MYWAVPRPFTAVTTHNIERWWLKAEKKKKGEKHSWTFEPNSFQISKSVLNLDSTVHKHPWVAGVSTEAKLHGKFDSVRLLRQ